MDFLFKERHHLLRYLTVFFLPAGPLRQQKSSCEQAVHCILSTTSGQAKLVFYLVLFSIDIGGEKGGAAIFNVVDCLLRADHIDLRDAFIYPHNLCACSYAIEYTYSTCSRYNSNIIIWDEECK